MNETMLNRKFNNLTNMKKYKIYFQIEHNLVLKEGRSLDNIIQGNIKSIYENGDNYLVRIVDYENYSNYDYIIEYSLLNIENIKNSNKFSKEFIEKILYLPPIVYDFFNLQKDRKINILTTYIDINQDRRHEILQKLKNNNFNHINVNNIFSKEGLKELYDDTKIILNIHQTPHHHTLEEFRILPALTRGVVIISEIVPMKEIIPYHEYIIWCTYENSIDVLKDVEQNYDYYYNKIFGNDSMLKNIIENMENEAFDKLKKI